MPNHPSLPGLFLLAVFLFGQTFIPGMTAQAEDISCLNLPEKFTEFDVDVVHLGLCTNFVSNSQFTTPDNRNAIQLAYAVDPEDPERGFSVQAVPSGRRAVMEALPVIIGDYSEDYYRELWMKERQKQGGNLHNGSLVSLFGKAIAGVVSSVADPSIDTHASIQITE